MISTKINNLIWWPIIGHLVFVIVMTEKLDIYEDDYDQYVSKLYNITNNKATICKNKNSAEVFQ